LPHQVPHLHAMRRVIVNTESNYKLRIDEDHGNVFCLICIFCADLKFKKINGKGHQIIKFNTEFILRLPTSRSGSTFTRSR